ncbi:MAG: cytochrome C oxidase subunit II [Gemmatimonadota bacterium]
MRAKISRFAPAFSRGAAVLASSVLFGACGGESPAPEPEVVSEVMPPTEAPLPQLLAPPPGMGEPGVRQVAPGRFEAVIYASDLGFEPTEIRVPVGAEVIFKLTSRDQPHGFMIEATPVAFDVFPEGIAEATHTFTEVREHLVICHVYCGGGHEGMRAKVIVEAADDG